jgi:hypothetical protein
MISDFLSLADRTDANPPRCLGFAPALKSGGTSPLGAPGKTAANAVR